MGSSIDYYDFIDLVDKIFTIRYKIETKNSPDRYGNYWIKIYFNDGNKMHITCKACEGSVLLHDLCAESNGSMFHAGYVSTKMSVGKMLEDAYNNLK